jgi:hypothetical protein
LNLEPFVLALALLGGNVSVYQLVLVPEKPTVPNMAIGVQMQRVPAPGVVATAATATDPAHHFTFYQDYVWEYHTAPAPNEAHRITTTRLGSGTTTYNFNNTLNAAQMYDLITDRIYLVGTKTNDDGTFSVLARFNPRTLQIDRERVLTQDEVDSFLFQPWDVCGPYWWFGVRKAVDTETLADLYQVPPNSYGSASDGYGPAWPGGLLVFDSDNFTNNGWKRITVTGPDTFDEAPFELGAGNAFGSANDGGYQRPFILAGNKMFLYQEPTGMFSTNVGYIVDIATLAVQIVPFPPGFDWVGGFRARWDPFSNAVVLKGNWTPYDAGFGFGAVVIDVATATVRAVLGGVPYGDYDPTAGGFSEGGIPDGEGFVVLWGAYPDDFSRSDTGMFDVKATGRVPEAVRIAGTDFPTPSLLPPLPYWNWFDALTVFPLVTATTTPGVAAAPLRQMTVGVQIEPPLKGKPP